MTIQVDTGPGQMWGWDSHVSVPPLRKLTLGL